MQVVVAFLHHESAAGHHRPRKGTDSAPEVGAGWTARRTKCSERCGYEGSMSA